jgi:hypothetical protein
VQVGGLGTERDRCFDFGEKEGYGEKRETERGFDF